MLRNERYFGNIYRQFHATGGARRRFDWPRQWSHLHEAERCQVAEVARKAEVAGEDQRLATPMR